MSLQPHHLTLGGDEHAVVTIARGSNAFTSASGSLQGASRCCHGGQVLEMREAALGRQHPDVAACLNNLAVLLKTMGRYAEAQGMYERCIAIKEQAMGPTHPQVCGRLSQHVLHPGC